MLVFSKKPKRRKREKKIEIKAVDTTRRKCSEKDEDGFVDWKGDECFVGFDLETRWIKCIAPKGNYVRK